MWEGKTLSVVLMTDAVGSTLVRIERRFFELRIIGRYWQGFVVASPEPE